MDWPGLFSGIGGAGIVVAVAAWLLRTYGDRLITHKFDKERLSFEKRLDLSLAEHSSATTSMAASQEAAFQRELAAMETLWRSVVDIRSKWPSIMTWLDMLTRDECVELFEKGSLQSLKLPNLDDVDPIEVLVLQRRIGSSQVVICADEVIQMLVIGGLTAWMRQRLLDWSRSWWVS